MKLTRIYAGNDGESHFEDIDLPLDTTQRRATSDALPASFVAFGLSETMLPPQDWHPAPRRQLVTLIQGRLEIEVADGSRRQFGIGESFIADDLTGHGHLTRDLEGTVNLLYVHLPDNLDFERWQS